MLQSNLKHGSIVLQLIDTHCHLDLPEFDKDRESVIDRAREAGLISMITIGIDPTTSANAVALAMKHPDIFATVGHHPHDASALDAKGMDRLKRLAGEPKVVGFGEIGLDFFRDRSPRQVQRARFDDLIHLGAELGLPLVIHDRDAHVEVLEHLQAAKSSMTGGVIHCYSGDYDLARQFLDMGFYISIPGTVTFPKAETVRDVAAKMPLDRLLIETDAPFLAPVPKRGRRNEPALVKHTAMEVARVRGMAPEDLALATTANARALFKLPESVGGL
jgi:TatD DNase family protein